MAGERELEKGHPFNFNSVCTLPSWDIVKTFMDTSLWTNLCFTFFWFNAFFSQDQQTAVEMK